MNASVQITSVNTEYLLKKNVIEISLRPTV
jgi:hypothetical protein